MAAKQIKKENDEEKIVSKLRVHLKLLRRKSHKTKMFLNKSCHNN